MTFFVKGIATSALAITVAFGGLAHADSSQWRDGDDWDLVFGSATATGSYFAGMSAVAAMLSQELPNVRATATVSPNTTTEVYPQMERGERIGGVASQDLGPAYRGEEAWEGRPIPVRGWAFVQEGFFDIFLLSSHGIDTIEGLADSGLQFAAACVPPEPGNPERWDQPFVFFQILMEAHGLDPFTDVDIVPYCTSQAIEQLGNGNIDGFSHTRALGDGAIMEMTTKQEITLLQPSEDAIEEVTSRYPTYVKEVPTDVYPELNIPDPGVGFFHGVYFFLHEDLPDDLVYDMTAALWENIDTLRNAHPAYQVANIETALQGMDLPPHPGALRYYLEQGVPGAEEFADAAEQ